MTLARLASFAFALACAAAAGCGNVSSAEDARKAYLGIDPAIDKSIQLGFDGFNSANSANISAQMANGVKSGTMTVTGQVDQGNSANKEMRLKLALADYSDDGAIKYATDPAAPLALDMSLKGIPTGTLTGTLVGNISMSGNLEGALKMNLAFTGQLQANAQDAKKVERKPGTTHVTGTATSKYGTYTVDVTR